MATAINETFGSFMFCFLPNRLDIAANALKTFWTQSFKGVSLSHSKKIGTDHRFYTSFDTDFSHKNNLLWRV